jgi:hypothetical protein
MNPAIDFLLKGKGPLPLIPFFRMVKAAGELGWTVGQEARARSNELTARGVYDPISGADLASPEILKYESSALRSSRII